MHLFPSPSVGSDPMWSDELKDMFNASNLIDPLLEEGYPLRTTPSWWDARTARPTVTVY